mmetsp:Transcript_10926/g.19218  ORF Transcript_10926/g.19218 Transcript_10926/m.19218 type:complete len:426 (-) Transcript_10926:1319-2596(-)
MVLLGSDMGQQGLAVSIQQTHHRRERAGLSANMQQHLQQEAPTPAERLARGRIVFHALTSSGRNLLQPVADLLRVSFLLDQLAQMARLGRNTWDVRQNRHTRAALCLEENAVGRGGRGNQRMQLRRHRNPHLVGNRRIRDLLHHEAQKQRNAVLLAVLQRFLHLAHPEGPVVGGPGELRVDQVEREPTAKLQHGAGVQVRQQLEDRVGSEGYHGRKHLRCGAAQLEDKAEHRGAQCGVDGLLEHNLQQQFNQHVFQMSPRGEQLKHRLQVRGQQLHRAQLGTVLVDHRIKEGEHVFQIGQGSVLLQRVQGRGVGTVGRDRGIKDVHSQSQPGARRGAADGRGASPGGMAVRRLGAQPNTVGGPVGSESGTKGQLDTASGTASLCWQQTLGDQCIPMGVEEGRHLEDSASSGGLLHGIDHRQCLHG